MKITRIKHIIALTTLTLTLALVHIRALAAGVGTAFTYQGRLTDGPNPANGHYDIAFTNYDDPLSGNQVGPGIVLGSVPVTNGLFTVQLDFGNIFDGTARWLQLAVRTNGATAFSPLSPRQALTPTPYAIAASNLTGSLGSGQLTGAYSNAVSITNVGNTFAGNGAGLSGVNAVTLGGLTGSSFWKLLGNAGTLAGVNFVGTTDNQPLELKANNQRALRLEPNTSSPNLIGGFGGNAVQSGSVGAVISGGGSSGANNFIASDYSVIGGGSGNAANQGRFGTIAGGQDNILGLYQENPSLADYSAIGGGFSNNITGFGSTISGGASNSVSYGTSGTYFATIGGGLGNSVFEGYLATIAGGQSNSAGADCGWTTVGGGLLNRAQGSFATIAGGAGNTIGGNCDILPDNPYSSIGGGLNNYTFGRWATIAGGVGNQVVPPTNFFSPPSGGTISGGQSNIVNANYGTIAGGVNNLVTNDYATVSGGQSNTLGGAGASLGGGANNFIASDYSVVGGGSGNSAGQGRFGTIAGGKDNVLGLYQLNPSVADYSAIGGGFSNNINGFGSTISGGASNSVSYGTYGTYFATIGGGLRNSVFEGYLATIAGGQSNSAGADCGWTTVGGGLQNRAQGSFATIAGGAGNTIGGNCDFLPDNPYASIGGGLNNYSFGRWATIAGGVGNQVVPPANFFSPPSGGTISGGQSNIVTGSYGTIPGGSQAVSANYGQMAYASGGFATNGDAQTSVYVCRGTTSDATTNELFLDGLAQRMTMPTNSTWTFDVLVSGRASNGNSAGFQILGTAENNNGVTAFLTTPTKVLANKDIATWDANMYASGTNGALIVRVTGGAATSIRWVATVRTTEVIY
jgi:hypothetical protein